MRARLGSAEASVEWWKRKNKATKQMVQILGAKAIPHRVHICGDPYGHAWPWWKAQIPEQHPVNRSVGTKAGSAFRSRPGGAEGDPNEEVLVDRPIILQDRRPMGGRNHSRERNFARDDCLELFHRG